MGRDEFFDCQAARLRALFTRKNAQYETTGANGDLWGNLERIAAFVGITPEQVGTVLVLKHLLVLCSPGNLAKDAEGAVSRWDDVTLYGLILAGRAGAKGAVKQEF